MLNLPAARPLALVCLLAPSLGACVSVNVSATRAAALATTISRADACRAGAPRATTLERFLAGERERGATPEQLAGARSTYLTVSEAEVVNQSVRPRPCTPEERAQLRGRMQQIRAGQFDQG